MLRSWSFAILPLCLALAGGCTDDEPPPPAPAPQVTPAVAESQNQTDGPDVLACGALSTAVEYGTLMEPGVVDTIATSAGAGDAPIPDAARTLSAAYVAARESHGTEGEPDAIAAVSAAGAMMFKLCDETVTGSVG